jgi:hypothetical protein
MPSPRIILQLSSAEASVVGDLQSVELEGNPQNKDSFFDRPD